jgi:hypothetical protein
MEIVTRRKAIGSRCTTSIITINKIATLVITLLVLLGPSLQVSAQVLFHGASIQKEPIGPHNTPVAHVGDPIRSVIRVRNEDSFSHPLVITSIVDVVHHASGDVVSSNLLTAPVTLNSQGDFVLVTNVYLTKAGDGPFLTDDAQAGGYDTGGGTNARQNFFITSAAQVKIITPGIRVTANCISVGSAQDPLIATFGVVSNTGDVVLDIVTITDQQGLLKRVSSLEPGASVSYSNTYVPASTSSSNTVTAVGQDPLFGKSRFAVVSNIASCTVGLNCTPGIQVFKFCGPFLASESAVTFTGVVVNTGEVPLTDVRVYNDQPVADTLVFGPASLAPGASALFQGRYSVPSDTCVVTDKLVAVGTYSSTCAGAGTVMASASAQCSVARPGRLVVRRDCPATPTLMNQPMRISGVVSNAGPVSIGGITLADSSGAPVTPPGITRLAPGQSITFTLTIVPTNCAPVTGTTTAKGLDTCSDQAVIGQATSTCEVLCGTPQICLTKSVTCSTSNGCENIWGATAAGIMRAEPSPGRCPDFCYRFAITNCGSATLTNLALVDSQLNLTGVTLPTSLAPGAGTVIYLTNINHCANSTNIAMVSGQSIVNGAIVTAQSSARVEIKRAAITCEKIVNSPDAIDGTPNDSYLQLPDDGRSHEVTFSVRVTNTGDVDLRDITITDDALATRGISMPARFSLAAGRSTNFSLCQLSFMCSDAPFTNTINVRGEVEIGTNTVCLWDSEDRRNVDARSSCQAVIECRNNSVPRICVSKQVMCSTSNGCATIWGSTAIGVMRSEPAPGRCPDFCYRFAVTNCGNATLSNISLADSQLNLSGVVLPRTLAPGAGVVVYVTNVNHCASATNTVTARGTASGTTVTATATASVRVVRAAIQCEKIVNSPDAVDGTPNDSYLLLPQDGRSHVVTFSVRVTNTGDVDLRDVTITDAWLSDRGISTSAPFRLAVGQTTNITLGQLSLNCNGTPITNTISIVANVNRGTNTFCLWDSVDRRDVYARSSCSAVIDCQRPPPPEQPRLCVQKTVVCSTLLGCGVDWQKIATGVKTLDESFCPSFCFRITVTNCGPIAVSNLVLTDNKLNLSALGPIPTALAPGAGFELIVTNVTYCRTTTNVVTAVARGGGASTTASDYAIAQVRQASLECQQMIIAPGVSDSDPTDSFLTLPEDGTSHDVTFALRVSNTGDVDLNVAISDAVLAQLQCAAPAPFVLAAGQTVTLQLCTIALGCTNLPLTNTAIVTATIVAGNYCTFDARHGESVNLRCRSESLVACSHPDTHGCRVTGGGKVTSTDPLIRFATHGGQVGAPSSGHGVFDPDSRCIEGNWEHVRHGTGGNAGNFHAKSFDSLLCACLSCDGTAGNVVGSLCNPGDRECGPEPRRAPANKIAFSGIGDYAMSKGRRAPRTVLYRVDVEDRGEPGGAHAGGGSPPSDRYRIRIWILTSAELARLNNAGDRLLDMRQAVAASAQNTPLIDGAVRSDGVRPVALGTAVFGIRAPDIDDGGELQTGNQQIHPAIKECH